MVGEDAVSVETEELMRGFVGESEFPILHSRAHSPAEQSLATIHTKQNTSLSSIPYRSSIKDHPLPFPDNEYSTPSDIAYHHLIKVDHIPRYVCTTNWVLGPLQEVLPRAERNTPAKKKSSRHAMSHFHYQQFTSP